MSTVMDDDSLLDYVQGKRMELVKHLTSEKMPEETATQGVMLQALRDMSHDVLAKKKIGSEAQTSRDNAKLMVTAMLQAIGPQTGKRVLDENDGASISEVREAPQLDDRIKAPELLPDETHQGEINDNFSDFQKRFNASRGLPEA